MSSEESRGYVGNEENDDDHEYSAYVWSDEDSDTSNEKDDMEGVDADEEGHDSNHGGYSTNELSKKVGDEDDANLRFKGRKKSMGGSEYANAVAMDEFSGGMDFDEDSSKLMEHNANVNNGMYSEDGSFSRNNQSSTDDGSDSGIHLEDDIRSNLGVLLKLFPGERIDTQPLLPSSIRSDTDVGNAKADTGGDSSAGSAPSSSSAMFGAGLIMQRYDPTKESDKKYEISQIQSE